jgi:hypothetical protein
MLRGTPFNIHTAAPGGAEEALPKITVHGIMDTTDPFFPARILKINLGEDHVQGGRSFSGGLPDGFPKDTILGKLIAGDDRPFFQVRFRSGDEYFRNSRTQGCKALMQI